MSRPTIDLPETFAFATEMAVRVTDINYGGHLGNDALLGLVHEARVRWLGRHGLTEKDVGGVGLIMTDLRVLFRAEAFLGEVLRFELAAVDPGRSSFALVYHVTRPADGAVVADVRTGMAFYDYDRRKPARMPPAFKAVLDVPNVASP